MVELFICSRRIRKFDHDPFIPYILRFTRVPRVGGSPCLTCQKNGLNVDSCCLGSLLKSGPFSKKDLQNDPYMLQVRIEEIRCKSLLRRAARRRLHVGLLRPMPATSEYIGHAGLKGVCRVYGVSDIISLGTIVCSWKVRLRLICIVQTGGLQSVFCCTGLRIYAGTLLSYVRTRQEGDQ